MSAGKLVVLGSINVDHVMNMHHFPRPGETIAGDSYQITFGGKGANQAVAAGRSGADITFIASVGDDDAGRHICQSLIKDRIDISAIEITDGLNTGVAMIFVNQDGENIIAIDAGANAAVTPGFMLHYQQKIIAANTLLMQLESPIETVIQAAELAKQHQTKVVLNPAPARPLPDALLSNIDMITPNETEAESLTGIAVKNDENARDAALVLHAKGIEYVIITLGSRGAWVSHNGEGSLIRGFKVEPVDTIAAGDTFNGALVTFMLEGMPLKNAVKWAHAAAAIAVTRVGAQASVPWREEVECFIAQHVIAQQE